MYSLCLQLISIVAPLWLVDSLWTKNSTDIRTQGGDGHTKVIITDIWAGGDRHTMLIITDILLGGDGHTKVIITDIIATL